MTKGTQVEHTFFIENRGDAPLHITAVQPSCDCTTVPLPQAVVAPGASIPLLVRFDSSHQDGLVEKPILVASDDPETPIFPLNLRGTVLNPYTLVPSIARFETMGRSFDGEVRIALSRTDGNPLVVLGTTIVNDPSFEVRFQSGPGPAAGEVFLNLKPGAAPHEVNAQIQISLDDPLQPILQVPVLGQIVEDVGVYPQTLDFGRAKPGTVLSRKVLVTLHNPKVAIQVAEVPEGFTATSTPRRALSLGKETQDPANGQGVRLAPKGFEIQIRVKADAKPGPVEGRILIRTTSPHQGLITIPIVGTIAAE